MTITGADIAAEFRAVSAAAQFSHYACPSDFDSALRAESLEACAEVINTFPQAGELYGWTPIAEAFGSGIEAWLQHELVLAQCALLGEVRDRPLVVRVVDTSRLDTWTLRAERCDFLMFPASRVGAHVALHA